MSSFNFGNISSQPLGATSTPAKLSFGNNFSFPGTTPQSGFGATTSAPPFGAAQTTTFGLAQPAATSAFGTSTGFGTSAIGFGAPQQQQQAVAPTFSFAPAATVAPLGFGNFSTPAATSAPSFNFAQTPSFGTTTSAPLFGGAFGSTNTTTTGAFGTGGFSSSFGAGAFGKPAQQAPAFGGFGTSTIQPFGQQQQPFQQQAAPLSAEEVFSQSIFKVNVFGDERDATIARWNYLQAMWGTGKAFYSPTATPVDIDAQNYLCRFKSMGYVRLPGKENKAGLVALKFNKTIGQVKDQQLQIVTNMGQILGSKPNLAVNVESVKALSDTKCQMTIYVEEKSPTTNETKRILATELGNFLNQATPKQQLGSLGVEEVLSLVLPDEDQLKEYLKSPPKGIDPRMWKQAIEDNPDSTKFIPVPITGFPELKWRIKCQETETETHLCYLSQVEKDIGELKQRHSNTSAKIMDHRRKYAELSHRILKIIVKQESTRKMGVSLSPEEEIIKTKLENMHALVSAPTQFKGRLSELLSQMRMQRNQWGSAGSNEYTLDKESSDEMKVFLTMQQKAMSLLIETVNKNLKDLKVIQDGMTQIIQQA